MSSAVGLDSQPQQFVSVTQFPRLIEAAAVMFFCTSGIKNPQMHIPPLMYFHYSSSCRSMCAWSVFFSACHTQWMPVACLSEEQKKKSLRPLNVAAHTQLLQPSVNNCSVIIHDSLHSSRSQYPSISSIFRVLFLSLSLLLCLFCQPAIISVLRPSCGKFEAMTFTFATDVLRVQCVQSRVAKLL